MPFKALLRKTPYNMSYRSSYEKHMNTAAINTDAQVTIYAQRAMNLMSSHRVIPTPENYTVWYAYAEGKNAELVHEINTIIHNKMPFTGHASTRLHDRFIVSNRNQKMVANAAAGAGKLLADVLKIVTEFSGHTTSYNQDIDGYIQRISADIGDDDVRGMVKDLLRETAVIRTRGEQLTHKLEESHQEIQHLRRNLEKITTESQRDFLTGVYNRKTLDYMLDEHVRQSHLENAELCLLMVDIDDFKQFNDTFGHLIGDEVLKTVARMLTETVRGKDIVARYGGEEFIVVLPTTSLIGASKVAENIRAAISARELKRKDTGENYGQITVSIGVSQLRPGDVSTSFIERADTALYTSKKGGRNRVSLETPEG